MTIKKPKCFRLLGSVMTWSEQRSIAWERLEENAAAAAAEGCTYES